jgi:hypothetical protein
VVIPLIITVVGSELILRPTLLSQAGVEMSNDAQSHQATIDAMFISRLQELETLRNFFAVQKFLQGDVQYEQQAANELALGSHLDNNYLSWSLFTTQGKHLISYPPIDPAPRGKYLIPPEILSQMQNSDKPLISNVYFDANTNGAFVDIYASVISAQKKFIGIARSTLGLAQIWTAVNNETNATPGGFAMIVDGNGVRIAYTNTDASLTTQPPELFKSIAPLTSQLQQRIRDENLYGNSHATVSTLDDPGLVKQIDTTEANPLFQFTPALTGQSYQAYEAQCQVVPWRYLVLRPVSTTTQAATQQDFYLFLIAAIVTVLAAIVGLLVGRSITNPILRSVSLLIQSSDMLKTLANRERATAVEQKWIVDSAQTGLKSVQYYAEASSVASHKLDEMGRELLQNRDRDSRLVGQRLNEIVTTANYLEKAASHQEQSSKRLSTAIRITTQVTEQLLAGATSASDAADQLEDVISQLRKVVGE